MILPIYPRQLLGSIVQTLASLAGVVVALVAWVIAYFEPLETPMSSTTLPILARVLTDFSVRAIIRNSSAAVEASRAQAVIAVAQGLQAINTGNASAGLAAIEAAVHSATAPTATPDPGLSDAIGAAAELLGSKLESIQSALAGTLLGSELTAFNNAVAGQAITIAQAYVPTTAPTPAKAA